MSTGFTSGPWLVHATNRLVCQAEGAFKEVRVENGVARGDDPPNSICLLRDPSEDLSEDETLANGFLIAAAPELYAELQQFVNGVETRMIDSPADETLANITARAKVALAKARGEQP